MIPKIIHYCWISDDKVPDKFQECVDSWSILDGFKFIKWDKSMFDINSSPFIKQAYEKKLYAFISDYIRVYALYNYGGIYMDMDIKVLKTFDDNLLNRPYILSAESKTTVNPTCMGCEKGNNIFKKILDYYDKTYIPYDLDINKLNIMEIVVSNILKDENIDYLPLDYFYPCCIGPNKYKTNEDTYCIHLNAASWIKTMNELKCINK